MPHNDGYAPSIPLCTIYGIYRSVLAVCTGSSALRRDLPGSSHIAGLYDLRIFQAQHSVEWTHRQVVVVREFVPEFEDDRAVAQDVAGDDPVGIGLPDLFYPRRGSEKYFHRGIRCDRTGCPAGRTYQRVIPVGQKGSPSRCGARGVRRTRSRFGVNGGYPGIRCGELFFLAGTAMRCDSGTLLSSPVPASDMSELSAGMPAPDFCLPDADEETVCLADLRGAYAVVYFYPKDNTSGCTLEARSFSDAREAFAREETPVFGISPDSTASHRRFSDKHNLSIRLLSDTERRTIEAYGAWVTKKMYGREYMGVERSTFIIDPEGKIAAVWRKVKVKGHVDAVMATLEELKAGRPA